MGAFPKVKRVKLDLLNSSVLQPLGAFVKDGIITTGWRGVNERKPAITGLTAMCRSEVGGGILAATADGNIYTGGASGTQLTLKYSDGGSSAFAFETVSNAPTAVLISGKTFTSLSKGQLFHTVLPVTLRCGAMRCGRLFGADGNDSYILRWSGPGGFTDWAEKISGAGSLTLEPSGGPVLDVFDFEDKLVVFRERSLTRFSVYGNPENFKITDTLSTPQIFEKTAAISGDSILFFSSDGLMSYRGGKVERIEGLISDDLLSPTSAYVYDGKYYFICGTSKRLARSVVYVYDFILKRYQIIDTPACFISQDDASPVAYAPSAIYRLRFGYEYIQYEVSTGNIDFGLCKRKLLTALEMDCDGDISVLVSNGRRAKTLRSVNGKTRLNMRGSTFNVTFLGYGGSVRSAYLFAEVTE